MHRLMMTIASHTTHITRLDQASWSIGSFLNDRPYICVLAIPVCSGDSRCRRAAAERSQGYIAGILDETVKAHKLDEGSACGRENQLHPAKVNAKGFMTRDANTRTSSQEIISNLVDSDGDQFRTVGATVFICGPNLQSSNPRLNLVGCIVLSSRWPGTMLPDDSHKINFYQNITKHCEQKILEHVDPYCAVCCQSTVTTNLVHVPLLFLRTVRKPSDEQLAKSVVMNLCRLFPSRWKYPEVKSALGADCDAQTFTLVVPVCMQTVCAEVAHVSARVLIQLALPCDLRLPELGRKYTEQDCVVTTYPDQETVRVLVKKFPMIESHSDSQRKTHKKAQNTQKDTNKSCAPEEQNTEGEEEVWIYRAEKGKQEDRSDETRRLAAEYEQVSLFQPLLNFEFWLLHGAIAMAVHSNVQRPRRNSV